MNIRIKTEYGARLDWAAESLEISVGEFVFAALEAALLPVEAKRLGAGKDVAELEALWRR